ncbi:MULTISPECIES: ABC transporter ATP-binding protein [unclassified Acidisoma]|uniref:ABC transporter ATP-binding protein n=1 Tax=unclassified Acidisoma TaxID=2634065 RepID=UPI00131B6E86|nr:MULTISPECIES: ABC transporter ATP-binding protein [unclassified Acidisoma]
MPHVELEAIGKSYGPVTVCHDVNLSIEQGEFVTLLGASGCGKTTTLNLIAGLDDPTTGDIRMEGRRVNELSPVQRDIAMVFQNYALYPHMSVAENIGFTLRVRGLRRPEIRARVEEVAASLELSHVLDRLPAQLSGGQQQRVAIGRALVREPKVFLFDEPFSNLDASLRVRMRAEVKELHQRLGVTSIFVTHDQEEAMSISDRIAVMNRGRIEQLGTPEEIYASPANRYVATFIGSPQIELFQGVLARASTGVSLRIGAELLGLAPGLYAGAPDGTKIDIGIRAEHVRLADHGIPATVRLVQPVGPSTHVTLDWQGGTITARLNGFARIERGQLVHLDLDARHLLLFDSNTGGRITANGPG